MVFLYTSKYTWYWFYVLISYIFIFSFQSVILKPSIFFTKPLYPLHKNQKQETVYSYHTRPHLSSLYKNVFLVITPHPLFFLDFLSVQDHSLQHANMLYCLLYFKICSFLTILFLQIFFSYLSISLHPLVTILQKHFGYTAFFYKLISISFSESIQILPETVSSNYFFEVTVTSTLEHLINPYSHLAQPPSTGCSTSQQNSTSHLIVPS